MMIEDNQEHIDLDLNDTINSDGNMPMPYPPAANSLFAHPGVSSRLEPSNDNMLVPNRRQIQMTPAGESSQDFSDNSLRSRD